MSDTGKWAYSHDQETFHGAYDTWWAAVLDALSHEQDCTMGVWVGQCEPPIAPEDIAIADVALEHIGCQDEYCNDWADGWPNASAEQVIELDSELSAVLAAWLDRHGLRPTWYTVPRSELKTKAEALEAKFCPDTHWGIVL